MESYHPHDENPGSGGRCIPLPEGTSLRRRYTVRRVTGYDDCSIRYDGFDFKARQPVSILEFFPQRLAMRALPHGTVSPVNRESGALFFLGSEAFLTQYSALTQAIGSPSIISVFDAFFENGTAYAITEQPEGLTLGEYLRMRGRALTQGELAYVANALSDALLIVHSLNTLHHDITAGHILLCTDGTVKLTDFSAAHETVRRGRDVAMREPFEDIRALGKTLCQAFTGAAHSGGTPRRGAEISDTLRLMFERMLTDNAALRFSSVFDLRYAVGSLDVIPERPSVTAAQIADFRSAQRIAAVQALQHRRQTEQPEAAGASGRHSPPSGRSKAAKSRLLAFGIGALLIALVATLIVFLIPKPS